MPCASLSWPNGFADVTTFLSILVTFNAHAGMITMVVAIVSLKSLLRVRHSDIISQPVFCRHLNLIGSMIRLPRSQPVLPSTYRGFAFSRSSSLL